MSAVKVKICGLFRDCDVDAMNEARPDYIGFVFAKSRRQVSEEQAARMRARLYPSIVPVGVFVNAPVEQVVRLLEQGVIEAAQLHGGESDNYIRSLKSRTEKPVVQAIRVDSADDVARAQSSPADFVLFDNGAGGTGEVFDWRLLAHSEKPFFLAGGLHAENVEQAIRQTHPYAVDLSSGAETDGVKDREKIMEIVRRIRHVER